MIPGDFDEVPVCKTLTEAQPVPIVHDNGSGIVYRGYAPLGTPQGQAGWKITRSTTTSGVTITEYADGNMLYDNVWTNRASLSYSR